MEEKNQDDDVRTENLEDLSAGARRGVAGDQRLVDNSSGSTNLNVSGLEDVPQAGETTAKKRRNVREI